MVQPTELVLFHDRRDISEFFEENGIEDSEHMGSGEMAEELCRLGYEGWIIPNNYNPGDDILLCDPDYVLESLPE